MHLIRRKDVENVFEHLNERTQTKFNKYNIIIYNEKDLHNMK